MIRWETLLAESGGGANPPSGWVSRDGLVSRRRGRWLRKPRGDHGQPRKRGGVKGPGGVTRAQLGKQRDQGAGGTLGEETNSDAVRDLGLRVFTEEGRRQETGGGEERIGLGGEEERQEPPTGEGERTTLRVAAGGRKEKKEKPDSIFVLSEALPVVSSKLVCRILRAEYVDMAELLKDNMEVERRRMQMDGGGPHPHYPTRQARREIPDLLSWVQCFGIYAAVVASRYPEKTKELLAYQTMMISEARRCRHWGLTT